MVVTSKNTRNGKRRQDALARSAALVHNLADTPETAKALEKTGRTVRRWKRDGVGSPQHQYNRYFLVNPRKYQLIAHLKALAKAEAIELLSTTDLITRFHEIREMEKIREGEDNALDMRRSVCWLDRAHMKERDAGLNEELAAIMREFAVRGITEEVVMG